MRRIWAILVIILGLGCRGNDGIIEPRGPVGKVTISFPPAPASITHVDLILTRQNFSNRTLRVAVVDSTQGGSGSLTDVPVGIWHLKIEALDASEVVRYRGESDVEVLGGQTSNVDLDLLPTDGSIDIHFRWGAAANLLVNGSFESGVDPGPSDALLLGGSSNIAGWIVTSGSIDYNSGYWTASNGVRSLDLDGISPGGIQQSCATVPGAQYLVRFDMAGNPTSPTNSIKTMRVQAAGQAADFTFDTTGRFAANMGWVPHTWTFTADSTHTTLEFRSTSLNPNSVSGPALDNVAMTRTPGQPVTLFRDDFEGPGLDGAKWALESGDGSATVSGGRLALQCQDGGVFPRLLANASPIPAQGDFVVKLGLQYLTVTGCGIGFKAVREGENFTDFGFECWQDGGFLRAVVGDSTVQLSSDIDLSYHTYEWRYIGGTYSFYFDGQFRCTGQTPIRPTTFYLGQPPHTSTHCQEWTSEQIDYLRIERPAFN